MNLHYLIYLAVREIYNPLTYLHLNVTTKMNNGLHIHIFVYERFIKKYCIIIKQLNVFVYFRKTQKEELKIKL